MNAGTATLKDATSEAIRDWVTNVETTHYILGSAAGPHPYPMMVSEVSPNYILASLALARALQCMSGTARRRNTRITG